MILGTVLHTLYGVPNKGSRYMVYIKIPTYLVGRYLR